jgi:predicted metal-dependent hydrolase
MKATRSNLMVDGLNLTVLTTRKRVRNVNARLVGNELRVSAPASIPEKELDRVVLELARKLVRRARAERINSSDEGLKLVQKIASRFEQPPKVTDVRFVTTQRSRWGSFSQRTGIMRLHAALRVLPRWVLESVVAHELAHVFFPNHSPAFWALLRKVCPETDKARAFLAGVTWIAQRWEELPPVERTLLAGVS